MATLCFSSSGQQLQLDTSHLTTLVQPVAVALLCLSELTRTCAQDR